MEMFLKPISVSINNGSTVFLSNDLNAWDLMAMAFEGWVDGFSEREGGITLKDECSILQNTVGSHMVCTPSFSEVTWCRQYIRYREREREKQTNESLFRSHMVYPHALLFFAGSYLVFFGLQSSRHQSFVKLCLSVSSHIFQFCWLERETKLWVYKFCPTRFYKRHLRNGHYMARS